MLTTVIIPKSPNTSCKISLSGLITTHINIRLARDELRIQMTQEIIHVKTIVITSAGYALIENLQTFASE